MFATLESIKPESKDSVLLSTGSWIVNILATVGLFLCLLIFFTSKEDKFARLHSLQAAMLHLAVFILAILLVTILSLSSIILALIGSNLGLISAILIAPSLLSLAILAILFYLYAGYRAYKGQVFLVPILGRIALKFV